MGNTNYCTNIGFSSQTELNLEKDLSGELEDERIGYAKAAVRVKTIEEPVDNEFLQQFKDIVAKNGHIIVTDDYAFSTCSSIALNKLETLPLSGDLTKYLPDDRNFFNNFVFFKNEKTSYKGEWNKEGKMNGKGLLIVKDKGIYEGTLKNSKIDGYGRFINLEGDYYEGEFKDDKANGFGVFNFRDEVIYKGNWLNDLQHGKGSETSVNGTTYDGDFDSGNKHGLGVIRFKDGSGYSGQIEYNEMSGKGCMTLPKGKSYEGDFLANKFHGTGTFDYGNGKKYIGGYRNDKKHGYGKFFESEDVWYEGYWSNKHLEGRAIVHKNGKDFEVFFRKGILIKGDFETINFDLEVVI